MMSDYVVIDYAKAAIWKQRSQAVIKAEKKVQQAIKTKY